MRYKLIIVLWLLFICFRLFADTTDIRVDSGYGEVVKRYISAKGDKFIIHIQDVHGNYDAQKKIARILEQLIKDYGINLVLVEGGSGNDSLSYMRRLAPKEKRLTVAERYLKNGEISGEEYLDIISDYNFKIYGIEDKYLYNQNMCVFTEVEPRQKSILKEINKLETAIYYAKKKHYPRELLDLEVKQKDREAGVIGLPEYVLYLQKLYPQVELPNVNKYLESLKIEGEIDFSQVDTERTQVIELLVQVVSKETLESILLNSARFKTGQIVEKDFYGYLVQIGDSFKIDWTKYPMFYRYWGYVNKIGSIDNIALFTEITDWEGEIRGEYLKDPLQKRIQEIGNNAGLIRKLVSLELAPNEYKEDTFDIEGYVSFLGENIDIPLYIDTNLISENVSKFQRFYQLAHQRDIAFVENSLRQMRQERQDAAVLIAGGFHTDALTKRLEEKGISYVIVKPKFKASGGENRSLYFQTLKRKWR